MLRSVDQFSEIFLKLQETKGDFLPYYKCLQEFVPFAYRKDKAQSQKLKNNRKFQRQLREGMKYEMKTLDMFKHLSKNPNPYYIDLLGPDHIKVEVKHLQNPEKGKRDSDGNRIGCGYYLFSDNRDEDCHAHVDGPFRAWSEGGTHLVMHIPEKIRYYRLDRMISIILNLLLLPKHEYEAKGCYFIFPRQGRWPHATLFYMPFEILKEAEITAEEFHFDTGGM